MKKLKITAVILTALVTIQCQNEQLEEELSKVPTLTVNSEIPKEVLKKLKAEGFDISIEIVKKDKGYLVEKDIFISNEALESILEDNDNVVSAKQRRHTEILRCSIARDIKVKNTIDGIDTQVRNAINDWNRVNDSFLKFRLVDSEEDFRIIFQKSDLGSAALPLNNKVGGRLALDPGLYDDLSPSERKKGIRATIRHELGHIAGLRHTNKDIGLLIPGTPRTDNKSVMNLETSTNPADFFTGNLSNADKKAIRKLYGGKPADNICF